jgi:hypothetical protein
MMKRLWFTRMVLLLTGLVNTVTVQDSIQVPQGSLVQFQHPVRPGQYFYLHVRETQGKDAGGGGGRVDGAGVLVRQPQGVLNANSVRWCPVAIA